MNEWKAVTSLGTMEARVFTTVNKSMKEAGSIGKFSFFDGKCLCTNQTVAGEELGYHLRAFTLDHDV
jgi:hypothetical protein